MLGYVIAHFRIVDPDGYRAYVDRALPTISDHGGRVVAADDGVEDLWYGTSDTRAMIIAFPSSVAAQAWLRSEAYVAVAGLRQRATATYSILLVEGLPTAAG